MASKNLFYDRLGKKIIKPDEVQVQERFSVYGIAIINNRILMVEPVWNPMWELPGGRVEKDESDDIALFREYKEETGYLIKEMDMKAFVENKNKFYKEDVRIYYHEIQTFYVLTSIIKLKNSAINPKEINKIEWIDIFSLNTKNCNPIYLKVIKKFIKQFKN